jgi:hypothetical protein
MSLCFRRTGKVIVTFRFTASTFRGIEGSDDAESDAETCERLLHATELLSFPHLIAV